jgi:hypothetical protein
MSHACFSTVTHSSSKFVTTNLPAHTLLKTYAVPSSEARLQDNNMSMPVFYHLPLLAFIGQMSPLGVQEMTIIEALSTGLFIVNDSPPVPNFDQVLRH